MTAPPPEPGLFDEGPPGGLHRRLGLRRRGDRQFVRRALITAAVGWLPVAVLAAVQSARLHTGDLAAVLSDFALYARSLMAAPLLVVAEAVCMPHLSEIARHFRDDGFVPEREVPRFQRICAQTRRLLTAPAAEFMVALLAYAAMAGVILNAPASSFPAWARSGPGELDFSPAGWWHGLVAAPLLLTLVLGWLWRVFLWGVFLGRVARLPLRLVAAHPDHAGGLEFVGHSARAFALPAFAFSVVVAGREAMTIARYGLDPVTPKVLGALGVALLSMALFAGPLCLFGGRLLQLRREGGMTYGALAADLGRRFERRWLKAPLPPEDAEMLSAPDFSATTDLYSVAANVYDLHYVPIDRESLTLLVLAALLPFIPVAFLGVPAEDVLKWLKALLL